MKIKTNTIHDSLMSTNDMLDAMNQVSKALKEIKTIHKRLKGWKKALDAGTKTQAEYNDTIAIANRIIARNFENASSAGSAMGQSDEIGFSERSAFHADDMIEDATN